MDEWVKCKIFVNQVPFLAVYCIYIYICYVYLYKSFVSAEGNKVILQEPMLQNKFSECFPSIFLI